MATEIFQKLQENYIQAQREEMQALRAKEEARQLNIRYDNYIKSLNEFKAKRIVTKNKDGEETDWQRSNRVAKDQGSTAAYNSEWKIAMLGLIELLRDFNEALNNSVTEGLRSVNAPKFLSKDPMPLLFVLNEGLRGLLKSAPKDSPFLPILLHGVTLNDKNALEVNITRKDDVAFKEKANDGSEDDKHIYDFNAAFKEVVVEWLAENDYYPSPDPTLKGQFVNSSGELLTKATLDSLKNDPDKGVDHYLNSQSDLEFEQRPAMNP
jgi:hypothetical protein